MGLMIRLLRDFRTGEMLLTIDNQKPLFDKNDNSKEPKFVCFRLKEIPNLSLQLEFTIDENQFIVKMKKFFEEIEDINHHNENV